MTKYITTSVELLKEFEGFEHVAYPDPLRPSLVTMGWGFTYDYDRNRPLKLGDTTSEYKSKRLLSYIIEQEIVPVLSKIPCWPDLGDNQKAALIDFGFNLGHHFYGGRGFETLTACLRAGKSVLSPVPSGIKTVLNDLYPKPVPPELLRQGATGIELVAAALLMYRNPGTNVEAGLLRRRIAEAKLWRTPDV